MVVEAREEILLDRDYLIATRNICLKALDEIAETRGSFFLVGRPMTVAKKALDDVEDYNMTEEWAKREADG